jgi:hypothetical protein
MPAARHRASGADVCRRSHDAATHTSVVAALQRKQVPSPYIIVYHSCATKVFAQRNGGDVEGKRAVWTAASNRPAFVT